MSDTDDRPHPGPKQEPQPGGEAASSPAGARDDGAADHDGVAGDDDASGSDGDRTDAKIGDESVRQEVAAAARDAGYGDPSDGQDYLPRDKIPYDPAEGLLSGTAITGGTEIPGEHENQPDVEEDAPAEDEQPTEDAPDEH